MRSARGYDAVLDWIDAEAIDRIYCGGDLVGYGAYPNEVCALLAARAIPTIYGNYDYAARSSVQHSTSRRSRRRSTPRASIRRSPCSRARTAQYYVDLVGPVRSSSEPGPPGQVCFGRGPELSSIWATRVPVD
jgi:hypothetical protein